MRRMISVLTLLLCITLFPVAGFAGWFSGDTLVTIDGTEYTKDDFKRWWGFWKEKDQSLPETADFYVDWLLLKNEAERMDLASTLEFKRQERIFLQSRGLLMLKHEAVDSQIDVTDDEIKKVYEDGYVPAWQVQQLQFADEDTAQKVWQELRDGQTSIAEILERSVEENGPVKQDESWLRPNAIDPSWVDIFSKTSVGEVVEPELHKKGNALYYLKSRNDGSEKDLAQFREKISKQLWREKEDQLTQKLVERLVEKYQVKIDEERLAAIDLTAEDSSFTDDPVITSTKETVSEKEFMVVIHRLAKNRPTAQHAIADPELAQEYKLTTAQNIINQSVTNWGTLDRHFEKEEPFKWLYQFNYNYRLVDMLERQLFELKTDPSEEELTKLYEDKVQFYTVPPQAKLYIVGEKQGPIDKLWAEVAVGKDFKTVARELVGRFVAPIEAPINHLDPEVKSVVDKLSAGETSQIFEARGEHVLVHLVSRTPAQPLPLEKVRDSLILGYKRETFDKERAAYLEVLRANTPIEVDEGNWKSIQKELGGA